MREIDTSEIGEKLLSLINERDPIDEDISIVDNSGNVVAVVITQQAYQFFLDKVEEEEDKIDLESVRHFDKSGEKNK